MLSIIQTSIYLFDSNSFFIVRNVYKYSLRTLKYLITFNLYYINISLFYIKYISKY